MDAGEPEALSAGSLDVPDPPRLGLAGRVVDARSERAVERFLVTLVPQLPPPNTADPLPFDVEDAAGRFHLLPQSRSSALTSVPIDLAINQQSLQEMTEEQVCLYFDLIKKMARFFYSCNLDAHKRSVSGSTGIVRNLQKLTDNAFPKIRWRTERPRGLAKLAPWLLRRWRRTGDRNLRRVVYEV